MRELLSNDSLLVVQLYEDKSLSLCALYLLYNCPPNSELLHNNSLLELIYFLNVPVILVLPQFNTAVLRPIVLTSSQY